MVPTHALRLRACTLSSSFSQTIEHPERHPEAECPEEAERNYNHVTEGAIRMEFTKLVVAAVVFTGTPAASRWFSPMSDSTFAPIQDRVQICGSF
jgi:hypothetical protein